MKFPISMLGVGALAAVTLAGAGPASAQVSGTFAFTRTESCIIIESPATFNSSFEPSAAPIFSQLSNGAGTITFNSNGTGSTNLLLAVSTTIPVPPQTTFTLTETSGGAGKATWNFTYTVSSGIITTTAVAGSFLETAEQGPRAGQTATLTSGTITHEAYISADGKELLFVSDGVDVHTKTWSNGDVRPEACTATGRGYTYP